MCYKFAFFYLVFILTFNNHKLFVESLTNSELLHQHKFPPCKACKTFSASFIKALESTEKGKFEGGDAAWEEEKLGSYATSEVRLTEIQERVCQDVEEGKDQCYALLEEHDPTIEDWWFHKQKTDSDFFQYFCIDAIQKCCPENHFGPKCTPCPGYPDNICNMNGKCKGAGTRKGSGGCQCEAGYGGPLCNECDGSYYEAYRDDNKLLCSKCHPACDGNCTKAGAIGCLKCKAGYISDTEKGCLDINECAGSKSPCSPLQFCVNSEGSYHCLECDRSCAGCTGDGPDMCVRCAKGYIRIKSMCVDAEQEARKQRMFYTRYLTYLGMCIATCIIFNKNTTLAALIGICVAIYISLSEYVLYTHPNPKSDSLLKQLFKHTK